MDPVIIGAIGTAIGAVGAVLVNIIKAAHGRNQNRKDQLEHEERLVELSSSMTNVNQAISELRNEMTSLFNGFSKDLDKLDRKLEAFHSEWKDYNVVMLRHDITSVYQHYKDSAAIPQNVYQSTMELYDKYQKLGGNSYVHDIVEEMKGWSKT